ncbi:hypothetical protein A3I56_02395 [Candidatus Roizmanbacteria bacterium RIFCSPLOWO2_02_FULL_43_10]|uniref:Uncharacterized protein n=1 Tax=Candidatus Roizmanbacteria bacterium RIFCSPLOWO2_02_FULL_43_10 TaxID=1802078 RepID=A0A1F7JUP6_9BACT|nr:MAG: hypothetical protein A3I56_02395 [Candidatus Roizmanbacteria bacterium RIFCSPLOWO2_02_FULL_43_10]
MVDRKIHSESKVFTQIAPALSGAIGLLLRVPVGNPEFPGSYIPPQDSPNIRMLRKHLADIHFGLLLQLRLDDLDTMRVNVGRILELLPPPQRNFFDEFFAQHTVGTDIHPSQDYSDAYALYRIALARLAEMRAASLITINSQKYANLPFAHVETSWIHSLHPEIMWGILCRMYGLIDSLTHSGMELGFAETMTLLEISHILAIEAGPVSHAPGFV